MLQNNIGYHMKKILAIALPLTGILRTVRFVPAITLLSLVFLSCNSSEEKEHAFRLKTENFKKEINGKETGLYNLKNGNIYMGVTNYGARIASLEVQDRQGEFRDVVLGFNSIDDYLQAKPYYGATIGRVSNRIDSGRFSLDSVKYELPINNTTNHLHGGAGGFHSRVWDVKSVTDTSVVMSYSSPDGEMGYPGNLKVEVTYALSSNNEVEISYRAETDKATPVMLTNHAFFNLGGEGSGSINNHILEINADRFIVVDSTLIPTGEIAPVEGTVLDFRTPKAVSEGLKMENESIHLKNGKGYDHNWVINSENNPAMSYAGSILDPESGIKMTVSTEESVLLFYGGNFMQGEDVGKEGKPFKHREAFCLETQQYPDAPNHENFPSIILEPDETYQKSSLYKFSVEK